MSEADAAETNTGATNTGEPDETPELIFEDDDEPQCLDGPGEADRVAPVPEIGDDLDENGSEDETIILDLDAEPESISLEEAAAELTELDRLNDELKQLRETQEQLREQYLRKLAEFDNYRKRTDREREDLERTAGVGIIRELVPVLDNFDRALQHTNNGDGNDSAAFRQGVEMIAKQLWDVLGRLGLEDIDPQGQPFQPEFHEAVQRVEGSDQEPGTVAWVLAKGYLFGGRLVRPAMVGVAVEPPCRVDSPPESPETEGGEGVDAS